MIWRANYLYSRGTISAVCTLHCEDGQAWSESPTTDAGDVAASIHTHLTNRFLDMVPTEWTVSELVVTSVPDPNIPSQVPSQGAAAINSPGLRVTTNTHLPPRIGGLLIWQTARVGRSYRGRMFTPPIESTDELTEDLLSSISGAHVAHEAFAQRVLDANGLGNGADWSPGWGTGALLMVVYSPTRHKLGTAPWTSAITGYKNTRKLAYLSSRDQ